MTRKDLNNFRQERRRRIRELRAQGWTTKQIATMFAREYSESPLKAFRWAYDWTLAEACEHFNIEVADDAEQEALSWRRLSCYENWPRSAASSPPSVPLLQGLAKLYHCAVGDLIEGGDYTPEPPGMRAILTASPESGSAVRRRDFNRLMAGGGLAAAGIVAKAIASGLPEHQHQRVSLAVHIQHIRDRLMRYKSLDGTPAGDPVSLQALHSSVTDAWRVFQESDYSTLAGQLPTLIDDTNLAEHTFEGAAGLRARELLSETLQLTAILLLKQGDSNLGWVAADRSMLAAERADSPLTFASAARILAYALLGALHFDKAKDLCLRVADHLEQESRLSSPEALSAYGALVLKAAMATAMQDDRATTTELLKAAARTAERLGHDGNHLWTAFGPTNVTVHYVSAAVALGDAGVATHHASQVQLDRLPVLERRAHHLIDVSRAFGQRSKNDQALSALLDAEQLAPEEVRVSPDAQALVVELLHRSVRRVPELRALAHRLQVPA